VLGPHERPLLPLSSLPISSSLCNQPFNRKLSGSSGLPPAPPPSLLCFLTSDTVSPYFLRRLISGRPLLRRPGSYHVPSLRLFSEVLKSAHFFFLTPLDSPLLFSFAG